MGRDQEEREGEGVGEGVGVAGGRALTDARLGAERAGAGMATNGDAAHERRLLDDLIERDRFFADERLMKFRERTDRVLARDRRQRAAVAGSAAFERRVADDSKQAEREATDALVERERGRIDVRTEVRRHRQDVGRAVHLTQVHDTDESLFAERTTADTNLVQLDSTQSALARARSDQSRRSDAFAIVTHDLRSPLTVIVANASLIAESTAEASTREAAEDVARAAARMERLLTDLLDVARIESGTFRVVKGRHDVGALIAEVLRAYGPLLAERGLTLKVDLAAVPMVASFDHDRVVQMISHLLGNAMKFVPPGGVVDLHVEPAAADLVLVLSDNGPGIHPDVMPHLFERFWQHDDDARRGLGLGLYICRTIAEAHGGHVSAESELGKGATFRISLPVA